MPHAAFAPLDTVTVIVDFINGAVPTRMVALIENVGMDPIPTREPHSMQFLVPRTGPLGRINIAVLARDTSGVLIGDTTSIVVSSPEPLLRLDVDPESIHLSSEVNGLPLFVLGTYLGGTDTILRDLGSVSTGTTYMMLHGTSVASVDADGVVEAVGLGMDTVVVSHDGVRAYVPVTVTGLVTSGVRDDTPVPDVHAEQHELLVYPNPATSIARIGYGFVQPGLVTLQVVDLLGCVVRTKTDETKEPGIYSGALDLSGLVSGVYLCRIQTGRESASRLIWIASPSR